MTGPSSTRVPGRTAGPVGEPPFGAPADDAADNAADHAADHAADDVSEETVVARVALSRVAEPQDRAVWALVEQEGPQAAWQLVSRGEGGFARFGPRLARVDPHRDLDTARRRGVDVLVPESARWPASLDELAFPPLCLYVHGSGGLAMLEHSVAIVGARECTPYGHHLASDLAAGLALRGWTVLSGAAIGIDAAAHRGALAVDGPTAAVLASGADRDYPASNSPLLSQIRATGLVVSESPLGYAPMRSRFLTRNRLIAALARATVVVEADLRSGSLHTARRALELGRAVGACPGPVTSRASTGCHAILRESEAVLVTRTEEVLELVGGLDARQEPSGLGERRPGDDLDETSRRVYDQMPRRRPCDVDEVVLLTTLPVTDVRRALTRLELAGLVQDLGGQWRVKRGDRSR